MTFDLWSFLIGIAVGGSVGVIIAALLLANGPDDEPAPSVYHEPVPLDSMDDRQ